MLTTTNYDGPAFNTRSRTAQCNITEDLTPQPQADTVTPYITIVKDTPDAMPKPLTEDRLHALLQMQRMDPFCKYISKCQSNRNIRLTSFSTLKDYYINMSQTKTRSSWSLSCQKLGSTQCLWKHMTNLVAKELLTHTAS